MKDKKIIFGAGKIGRMALEKYGEENIAFFIDNNPTLHNKRIRGIPVMSIDGIDNVNRYEIVIAGKNHELMERQLLELGVENYSVFSGAVEGYYPSESLIFNPYENNMKAVGSEEDYINNLSKSSVIESINYSVEKIYKKNSLFDHVEIETINRCNGVCDFCPVSRKNEQREYMVMGEDLFRSIIQQLSDLNYSSKLALFSNNEPFLDEKIIARHYYAREKLPNARMHLFTNGTLLTLDKFKEIIAVLDELVIDNYHEHFELIKPCREIRDYCEAHPELKKKVTIVLRDPHEILSTRGGDAPNRTKMISYEKARCILPFRQMIIRPDGKVSLCCNDPYGRDTMGDLAKESIMEIWEGEMFNLVRQCLYKGRKYWKHCEHCDVFNTGN